MSESSQDPREILGDPKRRAPHLFKGVIFQLWHSVLAWMDLGERDFLFLEGAEDFDIRRPEGAQVHQTRATANHVSLASPAIIEALANYWDIRSRNSGQNITYRYITTSISTPESGNPFGIGVSGLGVWNRCVVGSPHIALLKNFLSGKVDKHPRLKAFLDSADDNDFFENLVSKVCWDMEQAAPSELEQAVRQRLVCHGNRKGVSVKSSAKVADTLFTHVATLASKKSPQALVSAQFLEMFEEATHQSVSQDVVTQILGRMGATEGALSSLSLVDQSPPPRRGNFGKRESLERKIAERLLEHSFVVLHGGTGNGKTSLAASVAGTYGMILWASSTALAPEQARMLIREVFNMLCGTIGCELVVLDDFNFGALHVRAIAQDLAVLLALAESKRCRIALTSQTEMPLPLLNSLGAHETANVGVGALSDDELIELVKLHGCPEEYAAGWAKIVYLHTYGHPQLSHARVIRLQQEGWKAQSPEAIVLPPAEVQEVKAQARSLLAETSDQQADFIYRLSLLSGRFRRDYALSIAQIKPELRNPGDIFDRLVGPWIEQVSEEYFRISPLLDNAATSAWTASQCDAHRESIAETVASSGRVTGIEVNHVLLLSFLCRSQRVLLGAARNLTFANSEIKEAVFPHILWFGELPVSLTAPLFAENPTLNWVLRTLQLQVAAQNKSDNVAAIAEALEREITEKNLGAHYRGPRLASLLQIVSTIEANLPAARLISFLKEIGELQGYMQEHAGEAADAYPFENLKTVYGKNIDIGTFLFLFIGQRCEDRTLLTDLLVSLDSAGSELVAKFSGFWEMEPFLARAIIDRVWLAEEKLPEPDWLRMVKVMDSVVDFAVRHDIPLMRDAGLRAKIVICDEYLDQPDEARKIIAQPEFLSPSPLLADATATFLLHRDEPAAALKIWNDSFIDCSIWRRDGAENYLFLSRRKAAMAAGKLESFVEAAHHLTTAAESAPDTENTLVSFGLWADAGLSLWKAGRHGAALSVFEKVLRELEKRPNSPELDLPAFKLRKSLGQVLIHAYSQVEGEPPNERNYCPKIGFCSDLEKNENIFLLPIGDDRVLWSYIVGIEAQLELNRGILDEHLLELDACLITAPSLFTNSAAISNFLDEGRESELPIRVAKYAHDLAVAKAWISGGHNGMEERPNEFDLPISEAEKKDAAQIFLGCIVCLIARHRIVPSLTEKLIKVCAPMPGGDELVALLRLCQTVQTLNTDIQLQRIYDASVPYEERTICAAFAMFGENLTVEQLFGSHCGLVLNMNINVLRKVVGRELAKVFSVQWLERIRSPFALLSPKITVPPIIDACALPFDNMLKAAKIILSASDAVSLRLDPRIVQDLRKASGIAENFTKES